MDINFQRALEKSTDINHEQEKQYNEFKYNVFLRYTPMYGKQNHTHKGTCFPCFLLFVEKICATKIGYCVWGARARFCWLLILSNIHLAAIHLKANENSPGSKLKLHEHTKRKYDANKPVCYVLYVVLLQRMRNGKRRNNNSKPLI